MIRFLLVALALAAGVVPVAAQTTAAEPAPDPAAARGVEALSRFDFHVSMEHLFSDDERYEWSANFGGDIDLLDYGVGRATFVANYETVLGHEFRIFDPNQGNYILAGSLSARASGVEAAAVFHHVSRHLSDRPKRFPVDWNMMGGRVRGALTRGAAQVEARLDVRGVVQKSYVDYRWEMDTDLRARVDVNPTMAVVTSGGLRILGVDGTRDRGTQYGYRGESGVRLNGRAAILDLFLAVERRIDPYQLEFSTATWLTTGFRFSSR